MSTSFDFESRYYLERILVRRKLYVRSEVVSNKNEVSGTGEVV